MAYNFTDVRRRLQVHIGKLDAGFRQLSFVSIAILVWLALRQVDAVLRLLVAWDVAALVYLAMAAAVMASATPEKTRHNTLRQDQSGPVILILALTAVAASFVAIALGLQGLKALALVPKLVHLFLSVLAIACSWLSIHVIFAFHYSHRFYRHECAEDSPAQGNALGIPGGEDPDYWDFLYFSFVIGMTSQVSDIQIAARGLRRLALLHGILSFGFNTFIVALSINIVAGLL